MNEISVRLSDLQNATTQLNRSHQTISASLYNVSTIINTLITSGIDPMTLNEVLAAPDVARIQLANDKILTLANRLNSTVIDIELALSDTGRMLPHFALSLVPDIDAPNAITDVPTGVSAIGLSYISTVNQPLHANLLQVESDINEQIVHQQTLVTQRAEIVSELEAARNNALTHDPTIDLSSVERIQVLEAQLINLDNQVVEIDQTITDLQANHNEIHARLLTVQPASGADYSAIAQLEISTTSPNVVNNTYDCVNHVVQKLPIPAHLARDAHLWNDLAIDFPEYGITIGEIPLEGGVIVLEPDHSYADDVFGHVLYIESIENGDIWVTDNLNPNPVRFSDLTDDLYGDSVSYLSFPWHTKA